MPREFDAFKKRALRDPRARFYYYRSRVRGYLYDRREHWLERADYVSEGDKGDWRILGQDDHGDLLVPSKTRADWWDRRFNPRNPTHWPYYFRSRLTRRVAFLEKP